ncbi:MAG: hypothetical protein WCS67_02060 [Bacteroidales bacterium]
MRKLITLIATAAVLAACSKDSDPSVSFTQQTFALTSGSVDISIQTKDFETSTTATIPVTFSGSAVKGEDYTVSSESYTVGGASQNLKITVSAKDNFDADKVITMTLGAANGVGVGKLSTATITLSKQDLRLYSFVGKKIAMTSAANVEFQLFTSTGGTFTAEKQIEIPVTVDTEKSTAVEGTNFKFNGEKKMIIAVGSDKASLKLDFIAQDADHNVLYLKPDFTNMKGFVAGQYPEIEIVLLGSYAEKIQGKWKMKTFVTDKTYMNNTWGGMEDLTNFPVLNTDDTMTIGADLQTSFVSGFKNYFGEQSDITMGDELTIRIDMQTKVTMQILILNHINRFFSTSKTSTDDIAHLGVRVTDDGLLDVYVIDYEPKDFFTDFADFGMIGTDKPVSTMTGFFLNFQMEKVTE